MTASFDLTGPLPRGGTTLIEASAGTGKTYTLAGLTVRYVAEHDVPISKLLLVTFTRAATAELRGRIRERLVEAERHLASPADPGDDVVLALLSACSDAERAVRRRRLARAVSDFDTATISTIHGFCAHVRATMGVLSGENVDAVPAESEAALVLQVCADLYFQALSANPVDPFGGRSLDTLVDLVSRARTLTGCEVRTEGATPVDLNVVDLVERAVVEVDDRLRRQGGLSFDTLLSSVRDGLRSSPGLASDLRAGFQVAMVDEFQDTDPVQWEIFRTVFAPDERHDPRPTLVLVGDPKQAIYAFRGGDVYTYLDARSTTDPRALATNQRSDAPVLDAMNALGRGHTFGEAEIAYQEVAVAERNRARRAAGADGATLPGLEVRCLVDPAAVEAETISAATARWAIARDLACVAHRLISEGRVVGRDPEHVRPGDIAVLVGSSNDARPVMTALREARIPAVLRLRDDVADSVARDQWRTLLHALDRPASTRRAGAAALTWFFDWTPGDVAAAVEAEDDPTAPGPAAAMVELQQELARWSDLLIDKGMAALFGEARRSHDMVPRLLATPDGERNLTDLEHLAELVHLEAGTRGRGLTAGTALAILDSLGGTPVDEVAQDTAQRRIDSDDSAVQIMTVHGAKGLEFPFVLLPTLWSGGRRVQARSPYTYFDGEAGRRILDVTAKWVDPDTGKEKKATQLARSASAEARRQACGDQHRLTYVAMTRAAHQTVAWWTCPPRTGADLTGLARLLFGAEEIAASDKVALPGPADVVATLRERVAGLGAGSAIAVHEITDPPRPSGLEPLPDRTERTDDDELEVARLGRDLDRHGRVWSFTSMARGVHAPDGSRRDPDEVADPTVDSAPDQAAGDEGAEASTAGDASSSGGEPPTIPSLDDALWDRPPLFEGLGGGTALGNVVHHVLEHLDFRSPDPAADVAGLLRAPGTPPVTDAQRDGLPAVLAEVLRSPLGPALGGGTLADVAAPDRLDELDFHLPLAPGAPLPAARIGEVVADHLPADDPLRAWALDLRAGVQGLELQGFLTGSIDLTLRARVDGVTRYSVVDYKTNDLTPSGSEPGLRHYRHDRLAAAMGHSHYALQALLYSVALHRYLRWRLPGYDPATHLGPVGYLFVRGMVGPGAPTSADGSPAGVFTWALPPELVEALSDLFAGDAALGEAS